MECRDFHALSHAYALGALQAEEARTCEAHLADPGPHEACAETLARSRATVAWLGEALVPVHPGEHVWRHVTLRLGIRDEGRQPMRRREQAAWAVAVAALATCAVIWPQLRQLREDVADRRGAVADLRVQLAQVQRSRDLEQQARARDTATLRQVRLDVTRLRSTWPHVADPGDHLTPFAGEDPQARAVLLTGREPGRALLTTDLPAPEPGRVWRAWLLSDAAPPVPVGHLEAGRLTSVALDLTAPGLPAWTGVGLSQDLPDAAEPPVHLRSRAPLPDANVPRRHEPERVP